ncbi:hypothetical protein BAUCODRAFT_157149 [Baudoinia panamericana UAMH 10762]|uniref:N-acetyltransferase domain-containing protein n=1 Tax=Baudoinia panamericana (strain UAMH 10762) TaxID=717646 RepID=M2LN29_BAUPA|nr:uncharacterized protein BAUCODRAFT_157149 [Baudoinia panamericana UAMH 10762]EMC95747.1 hypothetical protein BAUCODRAFT_157149 [Baudoinia panamericana UAMH 10762]
MSSAHTSLPLIVRKEEANGPLCQQFKEEMKTELSHLLGHRMQLPPEARPQLLPGGSVCLVAELDSCHEPQSQHSPKSVVGSLCLIPLQPGSGCAKNLPAQARVGEIKRVLTRPAYRRHGAQRVLLTANEDLARMELSLHLLVLETLHALPEAQKMYESYGWKRRETFGFYDATYSVCYEKWL